MRRRVGRLAMAAMLVCLSFPVAAKPWKGATVEELAAWMKAAGYDAEIRSQGYKDARYIESHVGDQEFELLLSACRPDRRCGSVTFNADLDAGMDKLSDVLDWGRYHAIRIEHDDTGFTAVMQLSLADFPDDALAAGFAVWRDELPELMKTMAAPQ